MHTVYLVVTLLSSTGRSRSVNERAPGIEIKFLFGVGGRRHSSELGDCICMVA